MFLSASDGSTDTPVKVHHNISCLQSRVCGSLPLMYMSFSDLLGTGVNCTVNTQTFAVYHIFGFRSGDVECLLQGLGDISEKSVIIPTPACVIFVIGVNDIADKFEIIGFKSCIEVFIISQHTLFHHFPKNCISSFCIVFGIHEGIKCIRILGDACNGGTFHYITITNILVEVEIGGRLYTTTSASVVDQIEICFKNIIFGISLFELECTEDLSEFTVYTVFIVIRQIFDKLLGDGRAAELRAACSEIDDSTACSFEVNTVVFTETLVLNGDLGIYHLFGNILITYPYTVLCRIELFIFLPFLRFVVLDINFACLIESYGIEIDGEGFVSNTENVEKKRQSDHDTCDHTRQQDGKEYPAEKSENTACCGKCKVEYGRSRLIFILAYIGFSHVSKKPPVEIFFKIIFFIITQIRQNGIIFF